MPLALERKLRQEANRKRLTGKRRDAYIYGSLRRSGWRPKRRKSK